MKYLVSKRKYCLILLLIALFPSCLFAIERISGGVALPNGELAEGQMRGAVYVCTYNASGQILDTLCFAGSYQIDVGENNDDFSGFYDLAPPGGFYEVYVDCNANCGNYISVPQYLDENNDLTVFRNQVDLVPDNLNLVINKKSRISGSVRLPDSEIAATDVTGSVIVETFSDIDSSGTANFTITAGTNSVDYNVYYTPRQETESSGMNGYTLLLRCLTDCGQYSTEYYIAEDGSASDTEVVIEALPENKDFVLGQGNASGQLSGVFRLPDNETATTQISGEVVIAFYDAEGQFNSFRIDYVDIPVGESSVSYSIDYPGLPSSFTYQVYAYCETGCDGYSTRVMFLDEDGVFTFDRPRLSRPPETMDVTLVKLRSVSGTIMLPDDYFSDVRIGTNIELCWFDDQGVEIDCVADDREIPVQSESVDFELSVLSPVNPSSFSLSISCIDGCGPLSTERFYLGQSLRFTRQPETIGSIPNELDIVLFLDAATTADAFEEDNEPSQAKNLVSQNRHVKSIHQASDEDWARLVIPAGSTNIIVSTQTKFEQISPIQIVLYDSMLTQIASDGDDSSQEELDNPQIADIVLDSLPAGEYFVLTKHESDTGFGVSYELNVDLDVVDSEALCFPIKTRGESTVVNCVL